MESTHAAKRLRSKEGTMDQEPGMGQNLSRYVTTLRDKASGTPRRKLASRRSLRLDRPKAVKPSSLSLEETPDEVSTTERPADQTTKLQALDEEDIHELYTDPLEPSDGPSPEDMEEAISSPMSDKLLEDDPSQNEMPDISRAEELQDEEFDAVAPADKDEASGNSAAADPKGPMAPPRELQVSKTDNTTPNKDSAAAETSTQDIAADEVEDSAIEVPPAGNLETTEPQSVLDTEASESQNEPSIDGFHLEQVNVEAPSETPSENGIQGLGLRRSSRHLSKKNRKAGINDEAVETWPTSVDTMVVRSADNVEESANTLVTNDDNEPTSNSESYHTTEPTERRASETREQEGIVDLEVGTVESEILELVEIEQPTTPIDNETRNSSATEINYNKPKFVLLEKEAKRSPRRSARSGIRFSDDTSMLKDFLSRAQARKQARDAALTAEPLGTTRSPSPRRSPRKALASLDSNSPSPHGTSEAVNRVRTPPGKVKLGEAHLEDMDETVTSTSPVRRSTRKRLAGPSKTSTGAPSFIPVRRADGTEPVVLPKSVSQELALVTRTNTRRNKGQAKPPAIILKTLGVEEMEEESQGGHSLRKCKSVGWDQRLVYYHDGTEVHADAKVKMEEKRPKARRLRGLGAGNGTPAPKRQTADVLRTNGTLASGGHGGSGR